MKSSYLSLEKLGLNVDVEALWYTNIQYIFLTQIWFNSWQLINIQESRIKIRVGLDGIFSLKCVFIEFAIPNLIPIYICKSEILKPVFKTSLIKKNVVLKGNARQFLTIILYFSIWFVPKRCSISEKGSTTNNIILVLFWSNKYLNRK